MDDREQWTRIERIFHGALERGLGDRAEYLSRECAGDDDLRKRVESLLDSDDRTLPIPGPTGAPLPGEMLGHYSLLTLLGEGGMGKVYLARDIRLDREVAVKIFTTGFENNAERKRRLFGEAKAASALNHPNIVTVHDVGTEGEVDYLVMEYVAGKPLDRLIPRHGLKLKEALRYGIQIADALACAHRAGIVHRDLKPANVVITESGVAKVVDFGIAKQVHPGRHTATRTELGLIFGTVAYMSPEQAEGRSVDARSDIFSFGSLLYEMVTGRHAFQRDTAASTLAAVLREEPKPAIAMAEDVPPEVSQLIERCLRKIPDDRFQSMDDVKAALEAVRRVPPSVASTVSAAAPLRRRWFFKLTKQRLSDEHAPAISVARLIRKPQMAAAAVLMLVAVAAVAIWWFRRSADIRWARDVAIPQISELADKERYSDALALARRAEAYIPTDPALVKTWSRISWTPSIRSEPDGADVFIKDYSKPAGDWRYVGRSPMDRTRLPLGVLRWQIRKEGYRTVESSLERGAWAPLFPAEDSQTINFRLDKEESIPPEMVRIPGRRFRPPMPSLTGLPEIELGDFFIDRTEVTAGQYKAFVAAGGYQKQQYWKHPLIKNGRVLSWKEAMALFVDRTGRRGPSSWELGDYLEGQETYPVTGVSWYEAAAYAEFAGKSLPTVYHWALASGQIDSSYIVPLSNFQGRGLAKTGAYNGTSFGTYDMAGNAKEWCWNAHENSRCIMGGAWNEPTYMFLDAEALPPFDRSPTNGFRCVRYFSPEEMPKTAKDPIALNSRDYSKQKPVSEAIFNVYRSLYSYDKTPLNSRVESIDDKDARWKKEKITFSAAYGGERVIAYLFLPKMGTPPYQIVIYSPGGYAIALRSNQDLDLDLFFDFVLRSGRAVVYPIYKGTYERGDGLRSDAPDTSAFYRDHVIQWSKDLGRTIDYVNTRSDLDQKKIGFYGLSWGGVLGGLLPALEGRIKAVALVGGGFDPHRTLPEVDPLNFTPRIKVPVLMVNGRYDSAYSIDLSQAPMFRALGTPEKDKRHAIFESGHIVPKNLIIKEVLDWFDRYLGPVT